MRIEHEHEHVGDDAPLVGATPHARNEHYQSKALRHIREAAAKMRITDIEASEADMKAVLAAALKISDEQAEILYEVGEWMAACHYKKINNIKNDQM